MTGSVYLIKKGDFYMIGSGGNFEKQMKKIRPDEIIETIQLEYPFSYEARLLKRYRNSRLPESGYFSFSDKELEDCKKQFDIKSKIPKTISAEFNIAMTGSIFLLLITSFLMIKIKALPLISLSATLGVASLPMWLLFSIGSFGGYDCSDLRLFSSWSNRIKALIVASAMSLLSYYFLKSYIA